MAATEEYAYILPLADILKDIQLNTGIHLRLASPFGQLAELANVHYLRQNQALAHYYAKSSLSAAALSRSAEMPLNAAILKHIKENPRVDSDLMEQIVMRTGHHIVLGLPRIWDDAREGKLGKPDLVLAFLRDLSNVAGITVPHGSNTGKQKQGVGGMTEMVDRVGGDSSSGHSDLQRKAQTDDLYLLEEASADPPAYSKKAQAGYSDLRHESGSSKVNTLDHAPGVGLFRKAYDWMLKAFWVIEMDVTMIGLQNSGKTRLLRIFAGEEFGIDSIPTVGFNCKRIQRGHVTIKFWDLGGQPRFRSMWERYCRGVNVVVFVVNTADMDAMPVAREELHALMSKPSIERVPLLVLGNNLSSDTRSVGKSVDMRSDALTMDGLVDAMGLRDLRVREVSCYLVDARNKTSLDAVLHWLIARAST
jgi:ADP-ribosylation factor-like protein 8